MNENLLVVINAFWTLMIVFGQMDLKNSKFDRIVFTLGYMVPLLLDSVINLGIL